MTFSRVTGDIDITSSHIYDIDMHRTTINLDEAIHRRVVAMAKRQNKSMARVIEDLLRLALEPKSRVANREPPLHRGNGPRPGVDIADRDRLYDLMDG